MKALRLRLAMLYIQIVSVVGASCRFKVSKLVISLSFSCITFCPIRWLASSDISDDTWISLVAKDTHKHASNTTLYFIGRVKTEESAFHIHKLDCMAKTIGAIQFSLALHCRMYNSPGKIHRLHLVSFITYVIENVYVTPKTFRNLWAYRKVENVFLVVSHVDFPFLYE